MHYARLAFIDGDRGTALIDAMYAADMPRIQATVGLAQALIARYDTGEYHDTSPEPARGTFDQVVAVGDYFLTFHMGLHYVGLERVITDAQVAGERPDDEYPWCGLCGEWVDHCAGHGADAYDQYEAQASLITKYDTILDGEN